MNNHRHTVQHNVITHPAGAESPNAKIQMSDLTFALFNLSWAFDSYSVPPIPLFKTVPLDLFPV